MRLFTGDVERGGSGTTPGRKLEAERTDLRLSHLQHSSVTDNKVKIYFKCHISFSISFILFPIDHFS